MYSCSETVEFLKGFPAKVRFFSRVTQFRAIYPIVRQFTGAVNQILYSFPMSEPKYPIPFCMKSVLEKGTGGGVKFCQSLVNL